MGDIKIIEYNHSYANKVADMWNKSSDNWGGFESLRTEQDVINEVENNGVLKLYLALDEEEVIGYCSFSEYIQDEGASYIPLLNVRPEYHGKKIGKQLVLKVVESAIKSKWPRLDLYTWPGNTKAVPLYKKCGFFWEKRDDTTHLMNFIPDVLKTEAVGHYFKTIDWYTDSKRLIDIKTDGRNDNGFDYFEYIWEKDDASLRMEYERKGRGLRLIETDDYLIEATISKQELVFGMNYGIIYHVLNKSGKSLNVMIKGIDDKNIKFKLEYEGEINKESTIKGDFFVEEIKKEQSIWRTHPCVCAKIMINGKNALFKIGIEPKFPVKSFLINPNKPNFIGVKSICYLNLENSFDEDISLSFKMPESLIVDFTEKDYEILIKGKEKISISFDCIVKKYGFFSESLEFKININDKEVTYKKTITTPFVGNYGKFYGESDDYWMLFNGNYSVNLAKFDNDIFINNFTMDNFTTFILYPKLGLPYSIEFSKIEPEHVDFFIEEEAVVLKAFYNSKDFKNIQLVTVVRLYTIGLLENYFEVHNLSEKSTCFDVMLSNSIYHSLSNSYIPYCGKLVKLKGNDGADFSFWDAEKLDENWIFSKGDKISRGICWSPKDKVNFNSWRMSLDSTIGKIDGNGCKKTEPFYISWNGYHNYKDFRAFAMQNNELADLTIVEDLDFIINEGNPFVSKDFNVKIKNYRKTLIEGKVSVKSFNKNFTKINKEIDNLDTSNMIRIPIKIDGVENVEKIELKADIKGKIIKKESVIFRVLNSNVKTDKVKINNKDVYVVDNGFIKIQASPDFSNSLFSITYKNKEWLDSSFPTPKPKSWWSPWNGGIECVPSGISNVSLLEEKTYCEFTEMKDNFGNAWTGLKVSLFIDKNEKYKGLQINSYYLLLPGTKVLVFTTELIQNTGRYFYKEKFNRNIFIKSNADLTNGKFVIKNEFGEMREYKFGKVENDIKSYSPLMYESDKREEKMIILNNSDQDTDGYITDGIVLNIATNRVSIPNNTRTFIQSDSIIFNENYLDEILIKNLRNIKFGLK